MSDTGFFAEVAAGFRATAETARSEGGEASTVLLLGNFHDVLVALVELMPTSYPGVVFGLARYEWHLSSAIVGDGPREIGTNLAMESVWERGISWVPVRELNSEFNHWNKSDRGIRDRVPQRPEEIQDFRWPRGFVEF